MKMEIPKKRIKKYVSRGMHVRGKFSSGSHFLGGSLPGNNAESPAPITMTSALRWPCHRATGGGGR